MESTQQISPFLSKKGQTELEFMLILPFFLAVVFGLLVFVMLVFKGQMLTYATYMAGRAAAVQHFLFASDEANKAARQILPGVHISIKKWNKKSGDMMVVGSYHINPLLRGARTGSSLVLGLADPKFLDIEAKLWMHHFQPPKNITENLCNTLDDDNCYTIW